MAGPVVWNSLPAAVRHADSLQSFKRRLKSYFFSLCFNDWQCNALQVRFRAWRTLSPLLLTYLGLLTYYDKELVDVAVYAPGRRCVCIARWQHFFTWNDVKVAFLKLWRRIKNPTASLNMYLVEGQSCQISFKSDLKRLIVRLVWRGHPNKKKNKMSSNMGSDPTISLVHKVIRLLGNHCWISDLA